MLRSPALRPLILAAILLVGCETPPPVSQPVVSSEPANVGDTKIAATSYHDSGAYERDLAAVASAAEAWISQRAPSASRPAIVFDIDETALSNWEVIKADDFGRVITGPCAHLPAGPCGWEAWDMRGQSTAIDATLKLYRHARSLNIAVFFITGRPENQRKPTVDFKAPKRAAIEQAGYTIIANVGDQPSDLAGGHAEKTFLLPDPFYRIP
jgi:predicted secreted acid phosphatase